MTEKPKWHIAVKNTLTSKKEWHYILLYDFDDLQLADLDTRWIADFMNDCEQSYILRKTLHGYHLVGFTPNDSLKWGTMVKILQEKFPAYHDAQAIRIDPKEIGEFITLQESYAYPFSVNLAKLFTKVDKKILAENANAIKEMWYVLLYYTTNKKNIKNKEIIKIKT